MNQAHIYGGFIYAAKNNQSTLVPIVLISPKDKAGAIAEIVDDAVLHFPADQEYTNHFANLAVLSDMKLQNDWDEPAMTEQLVRMLVGEEIYQSMDKPGAPITDQALAALKIQFNDRAAVGFVIPPRHYARLIAEPGASENILARGLPVYYDADLERDYPGDLPCLVFYERDVLQAFLNRKVDPDTWRRIEELAASK